MTIDFFLPLSWLCVPCLFFLSNNSKIIPFNGHLSRSIEINLYQKNLPLTSYLHGCYCVVSLTFCICCGLCSIASSLFSQTLGPTIFFHNLFPDFLLFVSEYYAIHCILCLLYTQTFLSLQNMSVSVKALKGTRNTEASWTESFTGSHPPTDA